MTTGFQEHADAARVAEVVLPLWDLQRVLGAFDEDRIVGTFRSWAPSSPSRAAHHFRRRRSPR